MTQAEMERKLNQHGDDIIALYGLVEDFRAEVGRRFDGVDQRLDGVDQRFDGVDQRFDGINQRFDGVDERFDGVTQRLDSLDANVAEILRRLPG